MSNDNQTDKHNVTQVGDRYKLTVTKYFDSMEEASNYGDSVTVRDTPEKAASEMSVEDAEEINSNVNPAPVPAGSNNTMSHHEDTSNDQTQTHAPHEMGKTEANDDTAHKPADTNSNVNDSKDKKK